ncbi:hypothetical protein [Rhizobacter sp. OV335]|uniref:hypothetical protein n=1 Tax=Rhizobacter sp. OV335 TaxID=1500264 RepID=UPI00092442B1|nr:hypothetical protein [Rhizobacter sp. OV335]SHL91826.1 hypothetical protein SAMN02787076_00009 [Rhizobacter sp. OV335]
MQRRKLLQIGAAASLTLIAVGGGLVLMRPGVPAAELSADSRALFTAVAQAVLDGALPSGAARSAALAAHIERVQLTIRGFAPEVQKELAQLLGILCTAPGRRLLAGLATPWDTATVDEVQQSLQAMRTSRLATRQQVYHALRDITNGAYFSDPAAWPAIGYPGPREL